MANSQKVQVEVEINLNYFQYAYYTVCSNNFKNMKQQLNNLIRYICSFYD